MDEILMNWNLSGLSVTPLSDAHKTTWDVGGLYVLKHNDDTDELLRNIDLSKLLAEEGVSVAKCIPTKDGTLTTADGQYCLMDKLRGSYIDLYEHPHLAHGLGRELADLHAALLRVEQKVSCNDNDLFTEWHSIYKRDVAELVSDGLYDRIYTFLSNEYKALSRQLIHRDMHIRNFLYDNDKLSGWFDFDCHLRDVRIFDLASLLYYQEHDIAKGDAYIQIVHSILDGYNEINPFVDGERKWVPFMVVMMELVFLSLFPQEENPEAFSNEVGWAKWFCNELKL